MRYGIIGTGALGGFYGGLLAKYGLDVHFLCHSDANHVRQHGLRVDSPLGDFVVEDVQAYNDARDMPVCDVVVLCLKSTQNHLLSEILPFLIGPNSHVVVLQNGLHVEQTALEVAGEGRVFGGCCFLCSNKIGPGHIRHLDYGRISLGAYRGLDDQGESPSEQILHRIASDFSNAGIDLKMVASLSEARWRKLMWNVPFNGLSVILNASTLDLMSCPNGIELSRQLMEEIRSIAQGNGYAIEETYVDQMIEDTKRMVPYDSSMRIDFLARRPMEIEAIFGNPLRAAERIDAKADRLRLLYYQLLFLDRRNRESLDSRHQR